MLKKLSFLLMLVAVLAFTGCSLTDRLGEKAAEKITEEVLETGTNSDIDLTDESINISSDDGSSFALGEDLALPDNFPSDVPIYSGASIVGTSSSEGEQGATFQVTLSTEDEFSAVSDYYKAAIVDEGWTLDNSYTMTSGGQTAIYNASKEGRTLDIGVYYTEDDTQTMVTIAVQ